MYRVFQRVIINSDNAELDQKRGFVAGYDTVTDLYIIWLDTPTDKELAITVSADALEVEPVIRGGSGGYIG